MFANILLGLGVDFWTNAIFAFIDIFFGLMLWTIDNRGKSRQDESMKRQDESLDIILDQISKVNTFQTKVLSYAIETLEEDVSELKNSMAQFQSSETIIPAISSQQQTTTPKSAVQQKDETFGDLFSNKFQNFMQEQLDNTIKNIKKSTEDIIGKSKKDSYKSKKGLEFDLKHIVRNLNELGIVFNPDKVNNVGKNAKNVDEDKKINIKPNENITEKTKEEKENSFPIKELESIAGPILSSVGKNLEIDLDLDKLISGEMSVEDFQRDILRKLKNKKQVVNKDSETSQMD